MLPRLLLKSTTQLLPSFVVSRSRSLTKITAITSNSKRHSNFLTTMSSTSNSINYAVPSPEIPTIPVVHSDKAIDKLFFPVHRIYCVGRNYAEHAMEMGGDPEREAPFFFAKPADAVVPCGISNNNTSAGDVVTNLANLTQIEYPLATTNLHHEIELVVAIGSKNDSQIAPVDAEKYIYGYAVGVDLTRRDLQTIAKASGRPWCTAKGFDQSAPIGDIYPVDSCHSLSKQLLRSQEDCSQSAELWLNVNGQRRQTGYPSKEMIWSVGEIIAILSQQFELRPGDLIFTGTPAGVTALQPGDHVTAGMTGLGELTFTVTPTFTSKAS